MGGHPPYSDVGTRLGRWPGPAHPRSTAEAPQSYLIRTQR